VTVGGKQVAVKFEHKTSKGCSSAGIPYEWTMYREIRDCYGIPKLHYRGVHGDFYVMVRAQGQYCLQAQDILWVTARGSTGTRFV
jgi:hypothetical protein